MNAAAPKPQNIWSQPKGNNVTIAHIGSEEQIAHAAESFHQSPEPAPKLMKMEVFQQAWTS